MLFSIQRMLAIVPVAVFCSAAVAADQPPKLRLSEVQDVAPVSYRADLTLDPGKDTFEGSIDIVLDVRKPAQTIWLNANKIVVREVAFTSGANQLAAKAIPGGDDYLGLQLGSPVPAGPAEVKIRYTGTVRKGDSAGVFLTEDGGNRYILTQFESTDARDAFPCFDEPSYKVPWQLALRIPAADKAVSNTPPVSENSSGGTRSYLFQQTKPLPSYLIAFAVGPFEFVDAGHAGKNHVPIRIVTPKGKASEAKYAAEVTAQILTKLEEYFGIPFPYEKSDQVAVPVTMGFGAMENAGMVTYGQTTILAKPEADTLTRQREYATTAAHELAHQWFGDLVTTEWWNDIWLNEAFATWMEQKLIREWKPEWKTQMEDVDAKLLAENSDSLMTARKIRQAIEAKDDIDNAFDSITYEKGGAVIAMFESWMGPEVFRKGVQNYLQKYAFRTTTAADFLDSLSSAAQKNVGKSFSTFLNQPGVPVVSVALDCQAKTPTLHLEQKRFIPLGSKGSAAESWEIPLCIRYGTGSTGQSECMLMTQPKLDWVLKNANACPAWVQANDNAKGYYRVDYQGGLLAALSGGDAVGRLSAPERVDLLGNADSMADAGTLPAGEALHLVEVFHADAERDVVERALSVARSPREDMVPESLMPNYQRFLRKNFQARAHELGWVPKPGEPDDVRLLRPTLLTAISTDGGDTELAKQARDLADHWLKDRSAVNPEIVDSVLKTSAYYGDVAFMDRLLAEFQRVQDRRDRQRLIGAMRSFRNPAAIRTAMTSVLNGKIAIVDGYPLLISSGRDFPETRTMAFEFVKAHFDQILKNHPVIFGFDLGSYLPRVGQSFCDAGSRDELKAFFGPRVDQYVGAARALDQAVEGIDLCIAGKAAQESKVAAFLQKY